MLTLVFANSLLYAQSGYFTNSLLLESTVSAPTFTIRGFPDNPSNPTFLGQIVFVEGAQGPESPLDRKWVILRRPNVGAGANNLVFSYFNGSSWLQALDLKPNGHAVFNYNVGIGTTADPRYALEVRRNAGQLSSFGIQRGVLLPHSIALTFDKASGSNFFFSFKNQEGIYQGLVTTDDGTQPPNYVSRIDEATGDLAWYKNVSVSGGLNVVGSAQAGGYFMPSAFAPNASYVGTPGNFITFAHAGVSEDFIGYKNNTFFFKDSPGGGDVADPSVVVGGKLGIGTETLTYPLNVQGDINIVSGTLRINGAPFSGSQWITSGTSIYYNSGSVGIGTNVPSYKLDVAGDINIQSGSKLRMVGSVVMERSTSSLGVLMPERVSIGSTFNTNTLYRLAVDGTIKAREVVVENNWSDFVFADDYNLRPLEEVEAFIKANKHLPDIPSERDVQENGVSLGDTQAKLLQKIEELTLYMIQQKKELDALKATLTNQNK